MDQATAVIPVADVKETGRSAGSGVCRLERDRRSEPARYEFLDGLRGLAALLVVLHHAACQVFVDDIAISSNRILRLLCGPLISTGHLAVAVFIVLSGFCLMLPVAGSADGRLRGGFGAFLLRRARRILPPYYATLLATMILLAIVPGLRTPSGNRWDAALPAFEVGPIISHAFLFQNLRNDWAYKIVPPLWSVATEWQIYLLFPLLIAVWRRAGVVASTMTAVLIGLALSIAPAALLHRDADLSSCFWYVGLFGFGMSGAVLCRSDDPRMRLLWLRFPWFLATAVWSGVFAASWGLRMNIIWIDLVVGAATTCLILGCALAAHRGDDSLALKLLESPAVIVLGGFSYSLYLTHFPVLAALNLPLIAGSFSLVQRTAITFFGIVPACLIVGYLFYRGFERPFFPSKLQAPEEAWNDRGANQPL